ncbi:MAG: hypothetical protein P8Z68_03615 [Kineosporiaceae bacterium]
MLPLDSPRWTQLEAGPGGDGSEAVALLASVRDDDPSALPELLHQACHQFTVGEVAYAVMPHVVALAAGLGLEPRIEALTIAGHVAAAAGVDPENTPLVPEDLAADYQACTAPVLELACRTLQAESLAPGQVTDLLGVLAAMTGRHNLAMHLLLHGGSDDELSCPECGEYIAWSSMPEVG